MPKTAPAPSGAALPWVCPFCPLLCDHASRSTAADAVSQATVVGLDCPLGEAALRTLASPPPPEAAQPRLGGQSVTLRDAVVTASQWLGEARQPVFAGAGCDVAGARALHLLASASAAVVDAFAGEGLAQTVLAQQDRGGFTTTLAEVVMHATRVLFVGPWPLARAPRLLERMQLQGERSAIVRTLGTAPPRELAGARQVGNAREPLLDQLAELAAHLLQRPVRGTAGSAMAELAADLLAQPYSVIVWEPAQLGPHAALAIERLQQIVALINRSTRAGGFPLGAGLGAATTQQVVTWLDGLPLRTRRAPYGLEHDPHHLSSTAMLAGGDVDVLLQAQAFGSDAPIAFAGRRIVLAPPAVGQRLGDAAQTLFIPVATPGIHHSGHLFRGDGVVMMPLDALQASKLPPLADVLTAITQALPAALKPPGVAARLMAHAAVAVEGQP